MTIYRVTFLILLYTVLISAVSLPVDLLAQTDPSAGGLVRCGHGSDCGFWDFIALIQRFLNWLVYISVFVAAGTFSWAGWLYFSAGGQEAKIKQAHQSLLATLVGLLLVLGAWLIVYTLVSTLGNSSFNFFLTEPG